MGPTFRQGTFGTVRGDYFRNKLTIAAPAEPGSACVFCATLYKNFSNYSGDRSQKENEMYELTSQTRRTVISIPADIAENIPLLFWVLTPEFWLLHIYKL